MSSPLPLSTKEAILSIDLVTKPRSRFVEFFVLLVLLVRDDRTFRGCGVGERGAAEDADEGG